MAREGESRHLSPARCERRADARGEVSESCPIESRNPPTSSSPVRNGGWRGTGSRPRASGGVAHLDVQPHDGRRQGLSAVVSSWRRCESGVWSCDSGQGQSTRKGGPDTNTKLCCTGSGDERLVPLSQRSSRCTKELSRSQQQRSRRKSRYWVIC